MARVVVGLSGFWAAHTLLAAPAAGRLRGAPWNSLRAGALRSDNHGESDYEACARRRPCSPRKRPAAGLPRRGRRLQGRLSFGYFSLAKQRTSTSPAGARPGLRPQKKHTINYKNNSYQRLPHKRQSQKTPKAPPARRQKNHRPTPAPTPYAPRPQPGRHGAFPPGCVPPAWRRSTPYRPHTAPKAHPASWHPARPSQCSPPA